MSSLLLRLDVFYVALPYYFVTSEEKYHLRIAEQYEICYLADEEIPVQRCENDPINSKYCE
jgi:hypothetical protein